MNTRKKYWIDARDKPGLLHALIMEFSKGANISFEGDLKHLDFANIHGIRDFESGSLKRATTSPKLDFMILPLNKDTAEIIWKELFQKDHLVNEGVIHVQIEYGGQLVFEGYDNFDKDCVVAYSEVPLRLLVNLTKKGVIRNFMEA